MRTCNYYILRFISLTILGIVINDCLISASLNNRNDNKDTNELTTTQWADKIGIKAKQAVKKIGAVMKAEDSILECKGTKCPTNNIFIFYRCCEESAGECCFHIRYWLTIVLVLILLKILWMVAIWCIKYFCNF